MEPVVMRENWLLSWLDPAPEKAEERLKTIHQMLIRYFAARDCRQADVADLANETITRWMQKVAEGKALDILPEAFLIGIAKHLRQEYYRANQGVYPLDEVEGLGRDPTDQSDPLKEFLQKETAAKYRHCFQHCWQSLKAEERELYVKYTNHAKGWDKYEDQVQARAQLAASLGITGKALTLRVLQVRKKLKECLAICLAKKSGK